MKLVQSNVIVYNKSRPGVRAPVTSHLYEPQNIEGNEAMALCNAVWFLDEVSQCDVLIHNAKNRIDCPVDWRACIASGQSWLSQISRVSWDLNDALSLQEPLNSLSLMQKNLLSYSIS